MKRALGDAEQASRFGLAVHLPVEHAHIRHVVQSGISSGVRGGPRLQVVPRRPGAGRESQLQDPVPERESIRTDPAVEPGTPFSREDGHQ
jgi:hypothetical protein